jgi:hypothetical protein
VQRHFGTYILERFHLEVRRAHPRFHCAERMLDRLAAYAYLVRVPIEPRLHGLKDGLVLPPGNPALLARGALVLDGAGAAGVGRVAM